MNQKQIKVDKTLKTITFVFGISFVLSVFVTLFTNSFTKKEATTKTSAAVSRLRPTKIPNSTRQVVLDTPPERYVLPEGTHAFQTFNNCGPASLSMALSFYDIYVSQHVLGDELRPYQIPSGNNDDKSVSLEELADKGEEYGFVGYHRPNGDVETVKQFVSNDVPVITRTITKLDEDIGHYRVVYGYDDNKGVFIQNDSLQGKNLEFDYDHFLSLWRPFGYEYLVLVPEGKIELAEKILGENANYLTSWQNSVDRLENEVSQNPQDGELGLALSVAYYNTGQYQKSVEEFERVESMLPFRALWYQTEPLLAYKELGMYDAVLKRIDNILNNGNRAYSELYQIRGEIYLEQGRVDAARKEFETALIYNSNFQPAKESLSTL